MTEHRVKVFPKVFAILAGGLFFCSWGFVPIGFAQVPTVHAVFPRPDTEVPITQWQIFGPFRFEEKDLHAPNVEQLPIGLNRDYLKDFGQDEASVDATTFASLRSPRPGIELDREFRNDVVPTGARTHMLQLASISQPFDFAVAYVATTIESPAEQDIVIAAGVDDNMKLWLNHELLAADPNTQGHSFTKYQRLIGARLKKGSNFLLLKIGNLTGDWRLIVNLYPLQRALTLARENAVNPILMSSVVPAGQPLQLRGDLLNLTEKVELTISDSQHKVVDSDSLRLQRLTSKELSRLPGGGVYFCRIAAGKEVIEEPFFYGDLQSGYEELSKRVEQGGRSDESVAINLHAQLKRLKHLLEPESRKSEFWDQKVAWSFVELESNLADLAKGVETFRHAPGTHLRGYRSEVDGQVQHYWIHVPEAALKSEKPIPVVVALPFTTGQNLPFLESYFLAAFDETERYRILGDEFGYAVLQVWGRGNYLGGTAIGTADVFEVLEAVQKDYPVDPDRIYLLGYCEGGRLALLLGERFPGRFAAIATVAPTTILHNRNPVVAKWVDYSSPVVGVKSLLNTSVLIRHDEADLDPPIHESAYFAARAREAGVDVSMVRVEGGFHGFYQDPMGEKRALFTFLSGKQRKSGSGSAPAEVAPLAFGNGQGPIEDAFGGPILIVEGTAGNPAARQAIHSLVLDLESEWREAYFVDCPVKQDREVNGGDIDKDNLILVGDKETNSVVDRMAERLPLRATAEQVSLASKSFVGGRLGCEFIARNPLNTKKYVVVIAMNQWSEVKNWELRPSRDGVTDYVVYDLQGLTPRVIEAGYFGPDVWKGADPHSALASPRTP
jgi:dienelactone hydrolase